MKVWWNQRRVVPRIREAAFPGAMPEARSFTDEAGRLWGF